MKDSLELHNDHSHVRSLWQEFQYPRSIRGQFKYMGASLAIFGDGVYFDSKAALVIGSIFAALAILDFEMTDDV